MAYDEFLADRIRHYLSEHKITYIEKKMMGGLCYMIDDKMCFGIVHNEFMARVGIDAYENALKKKGCREMNFTGKALRGYVFVEPKAVDMEKDLAYWIDLCIQFNPKAKASKKKK